MMKTSLPTLLLTTLLAAAAAPLHAAPNDNERGTSVYDKNPDCMDRAKANDPKCTIQNGPPPRKVIGATQGKGTTGTGTGTGSGTGQTGGSAGSTGSGNSTGKGTAGH